MGNLYHQLEKNLLQISKVYAKDAWTGKDLYTSVTLHTYDELLEFRKLDRIVKEAKSNEELWKYIDELRKWHEEYGLFDEKVKKIEAYDKELRTVKTNEENIVYPSVE